MVLLYGEANHQTFLSTSSYHWQLSTGIIIPAEILETFDSNNTRDTSALAQLFRRPTLDTSLLNKFMARNRNISKAQIIAIRKIQKSNSIKTEQASLYWDRADVKEIYGGYVVTYQLLAERYAAMNATARRNRQEKVMDMSGRDKNV